MSALSMQYVQCRSYSLSLTKKRVADMVNQSLNRFVYEARNGPASDADN